MPQPKKATTTTKAPTAAGPKGLSVGQLVKYSYDDVPAGARVTVHGIITLIDDDGAYVAPLDSAAVVPLDQLRAV